jgi:hypothetical protein
MKSVVSLLVAAHLHDLGKLKQACIDLIKANWAAVMMSSSFWAIKTKHPLLWKKTRAALGLSADEQEEGDEDEEAFQAKRARKG